MGFMPYFVFGRRPDRYFSNSSQEPKSATSYLFIYSASAFSSDVLCRNGLSKAKKMATMTVKVLPNVGFQRH
jgi:hypothetical protein